ncbi:MAG: VTT domain-containing protein [Acidobacteriota bacterium]
MKELLDYFQRYGEGFVFVNVLLEQLGLPVPALPSIAVAGALAGNGQLSGTFVLLAAVIASVLADSVWFFLGMSRGFGVLKTLCRISLSPDSCVRQTEAFFIRYGNASLIFAKFIPGFSTVAPPMSGATGVRFGTFLLYDGIGSLLWAGAGLFVGFLFRNVIDRLLERLEDLGFWALILLGCALGLFILIKWYQRRRFFRVLRMARVTAGELQAMIEGGQEPLILDVRTGRMGDTVRIPGARKIHTDEIESILDELPVNRDIILYCT